MSTRDLLLMELYTTQQDSDLLALAARYAPLLRFDAREPFLPLAAGFTIFTADGPSPSMQREARLSPPGQPRASAAVEYALWWDWDIHHLYELEHAWIYVDDQGQIVRVEASWHGEYRAIPLRLEDGRAVLLSEPGKHAFAPNPDWFRRRAWESRRVETLAVAAHACVLVNAMFAGQIRQRVFDQTLVRSYLVQQAFEPAWDFSKTFTFRPEWLVPWPVLKEWIPRRVNVLLERLENTTLAANYRALRLFSGGTSLPEVEAAARAGAEALFLPLRLSGDRLRLADNPAAPDIAEVTRFCRSEPLLAVCQPGDQAAVEHLASFVRAEKLRDSLVVTSPEPAWLRRYTDLVQSGVTALQLPQPGPDPVHAAQGCGARFVLPRWENLPARRELLSAQWVRQVHSAGLGIISWPVDQVEDCEALQRQGVDVLWQEPTLAGG
jgi:hypothetical protein